MLLRKHFSQLVLLTRFPSIVVPHGVFHPGKSHRKEVGSESDGYPAVKFQEQPAPRSTQPPSRGDVIRLGAVIDLIKEGESRSAEAEM